VLRLVAQGFSNKEIAGQLGVSAKTIEVHKANGMHKLGLRGRIELTRYALHQGWLHEV
jgi:DNA-binding NarL/FixJ family response regulator